MGIPPNAHEAKTDVLHDPSPQGSPEAQKVLDSLSQSYVLGLLRIPPEDLEQAAGESPLLRTVTITRQLLTVLRDEGVLGAFLLTSDAQQRDFIRWMDVTDTDDLREERTQMFISSLKASNNSRAQSARVEPAA